MLQHERLGEPCSSQRWGGPSRRSLVRQESEARCFGCFSLKHFPDIKAESPGQMKLELLEKCNLETKLAASWARETRDQDLRVRAGAGLGRFSPAASGAVLVRCHGRIQASFCNRLQQKSSQILNICFVDSTST